MGSMIRLPDKKEGFSLELLFHGFPEMGSMDVTTPGVSNNKLTINLTYSYSSLPRCAVCYASKAVSCVKFGVYCHRCGSSEELT